MGLTGVGEFPKRKKLQTVAAIRTYERGGKAMWASFYSGKLLSKNKRKATHHQIQLACVAILQVGPFRVDCQKVSKSPRFLFPEKSKSRCYILMHIFMSQSSNSCCCRFFKAATFSIMSCIFYFIF